MAMAMNEGSTMMRTTDDWEEKFRKMQSDRCAVEVRDIMERPIDGVHYVTITQKDGLNVMPFELTKYGLVLEFALPKKFPLVAPMPSFYNGIPKIPNVDQTTGRIERLFLADGSEYEWSTMHKIRDLCALVVEVLARANAPLAPPNPPAGQDTLDENRYTMLVSPREFSHLCGQGMALIDQLKAEFGRDECRIKFRSNKKRDEGPALLIDSSSRQTIERVVTRVHEYLTRKGYRRGSPAPRVAQVGQGGGASAGGSVQHTETDDALAFFNFGSPVQTSGNNVAVDGYNSTGHHVNEAEIDLMSFEEVALPMTPIKPMNDDETPRAEASAATPINLMDIDMDGKGDGDDAGGKVDAWEMYSAMYCPKPVAVEPIAQSQKTTYTHGEIARIAHQIQVSFEKVWLQRSLIWANISNKVAVLEAKLDRIETGPYARLVQYYETQRRTIINQREVIARRAREINQAEQEVENFTCDVCLERLKNTAFQCGHLFCTECAQDLASRNLLCPICRERIRQVLPITY